MDDAPRTQGPLPLWEPLEAEDDEAPASGPDTQDLPVHDDRPATDDRRAADLRLARLHLRLGSLALARAELEAAHAQATLTGGALLDLAEARWRSGDLPAAGGAAGAFLDAADEPASVLATVIAVEAALADGRPSDARRRHDALPAASPGQLDAVFAGMPRSALWPEEAGSLAAPAPAGSGPVPAGTPRQAASVGGQGSGSPGSSPINAVGEMDAARADLGAGRDGEASIRLSLVLRLAPHLAPAVLELLEGASGPMPDLVRGDAFRLVGRATEAERAWRSAASQVDREDGARERRAQPAPRSAPYAPLAPAAEPHPLAPADHHLAIPGAQAPAREPESEEAP